MEHWRAGTSKFTSREGNPQIRKEGVGYQCPGPSPPAKRHGVRILASPLLHQSAPLFNLLVLIKAQDSLVLWCVGSPGPNDSLLTAQMERVTETLGTTRPFKKSKTKIKEARMRRLTLVLALAVGALVLTTALPMADPVEQVILLDECDPVTFNLAVGPGTCVNVGGRVTFTTFLAALPTGHPAWLFSPAKLAIKEGDTARVTNEGGEVHTFTEVASFGNGFIPALNTPTGSTAAIPECQGGFLNAQVASGRVIQGSSVTVTGLAEGTHLFQCCIHPWMRMEIDVHTED